MDGIGTHITTGILSPRQILFNSFPARVLQRNNLFDILTMGKMLLQQRCQHMAATLPMWCKTAYNQ